MGELIADPRRQGLIVPAYALLAEGIEVGEGGLAIGHGKVGRPGGDGEQFQVAGSGDLVGGLDQTVENWSGEPSRGGQTVEGGAQLPFALEVILAVDVPDLRPPVEGGPGLDAGHDVAEP